ncbi:hypothetical protein OHA40_09895 [Nocardia sp. NBC_00508]|uniref:hypothetical protein n=1 Tax=Nocardia sp. NBC_00508 TaxID=2975992 RepID=UPI002E801230|nr:hypothetical protein [Nocardia sp. NBC_00508]WUD68382.1 hypothetical protein OHA40_09895 [Nocardia sp. NBC_00508]
MFVDGFTSAAQQSDGQPSSTRTVPLLEPAQLFQAISGRFTSALPLVGWARELGDLHAELLPFLVDQAPRPRGFDGEQIRALIEKVVGEIDAWAARNIPRTNNARKHTHSLGEVISHIAKTYAEAWWTVLHSADVELRHQAWFHLGEAREGYAEMVNEIRARQLQLPLGISGIRRGRMHWKIE